jgi:hypothetical protein
MVQVEQPAPFGGGRLPLPQTEVTRLVNELVRGAAGGPGGDVFSSKRLEFNGRADDDLAFITPTGDPRFLAGSSRHVRLVDLTNMTEVRFTTRVMTASTSPNTPRLRLVYALAFSSSFGDYSNINDDGNAVCSLAATGQITNDWVKLATAAATKGVQVAVLEEGGDSSAEARVGAVVAEFR